eukprot:636647-Prymnesium_polylepis.1
MRLWAGLAGALRNPGRRRPAHARARARMARLPVWGVCSADVRSPRAESTHGRRESQHHESQRVTSVHRTRSWR